MIPADLHDFLVGCLGASASFIGLLFVGLSVVIDKSQATQKLADTDRLLAESSYAGLINIFFVTLLALLPATSIGYVSFIMAILGLLSCWRLRKLSNATPLISSAIVYVIELGFGFYIITHTHNVINIGVFEAIICALFAISLLRAWGLTGIRNNHR
jgi:hypothetical protein